MCSDKGKNRSVAGTVGALWGILGLSLLLGRGLVSLFPYVRELPHLELKWFHGVLMAVWIVLMGYAEGYKGFHLKFAPRAAARAHYLKRHPTVARVLLAPLFCMGFFYATRRRKVISYSLTAAIIGLIILCGKLAQPWRGIVDAGVLVGLGWGMGSVWFFSIRAFFGPDAGMGLTSLEQLSE